MTYIYEDGENYYDCIVSDSDVESDDAELDN